MTPLPDMAQLPEIWHDDDIFTVAHAAFVMERGACEDALKYVGKSIAAAAAAEPAAALRCAADRLPLERLDACAAVKPWFALRYAADRLTPERLDACAVADPCIALQYAADRMTPERLQWCVGEINE